MFLFNLIPYHLLLPAIRQVRGSVLGAINGEGQILDLQGGNHSTELDVTSVADLLGL